MSNEWLVKSTHREMDSLQEELWNLIRGNKIEQLKNFLRDFNVQEFYQPNFDGEEESLFNSPLTLEKACFAYETSGSFQALEILFEYGLKASDNDGYNNVLQYYIMQGGENEEVIALLLKNQAHFEDYGKDGLNLLHRLAEREEIQKLKIALKYGANIDSPTRIQLNNKTILEKTPLMIAVLMKAKISTIEQLLSLGANINATTHFKSVLDMATSQEMINFLKEKGAKSYKELFS